MLDDAIADINKSIVGINATNKNLQRILAQLIRRNRDSSTPSTVLRRDASAPTPRSGSLKSPAPKS